MRWLRSNGHALEVREVGPVELRLVPADPRVPIKIRDDLLPDDAARDVLRSLLRSGHCVKGALDDGS